MGSIVRNVLATVTMIVVVIVCAICFVNGDSGELPNDIHMA